MGINKLLDELIRKTIAGTSGWNVGGSRIPGKGNPGSGGRDRGSMAKPYPIGSMIKDPDERPELEEEKKEDLGFGFNDAGYPYQDKYEFQGMPIAVENTVGSERKWKDDESGESGSTLMRFDYGCIEDHTGADGDEIDVYIGPNEDAEFIYVIHQNKKPDFDEYDEDKVMLGFDSEEAAKEAYLMHYNDERFYGGMSSMPVEEFKNKLKKKDTKKITNEAKEEIIEYDVLDVDDVYSILERFKNQLQKKGITEIDNLKFLGAGTRGTAWDMGSNKVLKVTSDPSEAQAAYSIKDKNLKHVYKIYDVFRFPGLKDTVERTSVFGIIQEKLTKLSQTEYRTWNSTYNVIRDYLIDVSEPTFDGLNDWLNDQENSKFANEDDKKDIARVRKSIEKFNLKNIMDELENSDIQFFDYHAGNLMKRGSDYVIIDLGFSQSKGGEVPILEEKEKNQTYDTQDVDDLKRLMSRFKKSLNKKGVKNIEKMDHPLGQGMMGTAYDIGNGKVLKITIDYSEAKAANLIKDKNLNYVYKVYDVFRFPDSVPEDIKNGTEIYGIIQERLQKLSQEEKVEFNLLTDYIDDFFFNKRSKEDFTWENLLDWYEDAMYGYGNYKDRKKRIIDGKDIRKAIEILETKYNMPEIMDELHNQGIEFADYHGGNLMKKGSKYVMIDLGVSKSEGGEDIPSLKESNIKDYKGIHKSITHLDDLSPDKFIAFLKKFKDLEIEDGLEVQEKVDGSAGIFFGINDGKLFTWSKNGQKVFDSQKYTEGGLPNVALKKAHDALQGSEKQIAKHWPSDNILMSAEVLYTKIPNSIEYGPNVIMVHGVYSKDKVFGSKEQKDIVDAVSKSVGNKLKSENEEWIFEYKPIINKDDLNIDVKKEYKTLEDIYKSLNKSMMMRDKKILKDKFKNIQTELKKKLVKQLLRNKKSKYGPEGGSVEGLVFRDLESGDLTKLVDKNYFTKLNKFMWKYRELLGKGIKIDDVWVPGITQELRNKFADTILGASVAKTPGFVDYLYRNYSGIDFPKEANTSEKKADYIIYKYIKDNDLMKGDFESKFEDMLSEIIINFNKLKSEWNKNKKGNVKVDITSDEGEFLKTVEMPEEVKSRTDDAFDQTREFLSGMEATVEKLSSIKDDGTKKVALLKVVMGNRFTKLASKFSDNNESRSMLKEVSYDKPAKVKDLSDEHVNLLKQRKGIDIQKANELGTGTQGTALDIGENKILKLTRDKLEAIASNKLKDKKLKHIVNISDVFRFKDSEIYGIVTEKLEPLSDQEIRIFNKMLIDTLLPKLLPKFNFDWDKTVEDIYDLAEFRMKKNYGSYDDPKAKEYLKSIDRAIDSFEKVYKLKDINDELLSNGIKFQDYQGANLMKRGSDYVLIDIGLSKTEGGAEPEVLENILIKELHNLFEDKTSDLKKKFPSIANDIQKVSDIDPSKGKKYLTWAAKVLNNKEAKVDDVIKVISAFDRYQSKLQKKDIHQWKFKELQKHLEDLSKSGDALSNKDKAELAKDGAEKIFEDKEAMIYRIDTKEASCKYGKGTKWCISANIDNLYDKYSDENILFYFIISKIFNEDNPYYKIAYAIPIKKQDRKNNEIIMWQIFDATDRDITYIESKPYGAKKFVDYQNKIFEDAKKSVIQNILNKFYNYELTEKQFSDKFLEILLEHSVPIDAIIDIPEKKFDEMYETYLEYFKKFNLGKSFIEKQMDILLTKYPWPSAIMLFMFNVPNANAERLRKAIYEHSLNKKSLIYYLDLQNLELIDIDNSVITKEIHNIFRKSIEDFKKFLHKTKDWNYDISYYNELEHFLILRNKSKNPKIFDRILDIELPKISKDNSKLHNNLKITIDTVTSNSNYPYTGKYLDENKNLFERKSDTIGITIGRFQPFHKAHANMIRSLTQKYNKVIILVAGLNQDKKNPFSYNLRHEMIKESLKDVEPKIEVYKAEVDGKQSGYIPGVINSIIKDHNSSIEFDTAAEIIVGDDRYDSIKKQLEHSIKYKDDEGFYFDPSLYVVTKNSRIDDNGDEVTGTKIREAIINNNKDYVKKSLDAHLVSNITKFDEIYNSMKGELTQAGLVKEDLEDIGGEKGALQIIKINGEALMNKKGINISRLRMLGAGQMGVAYDIGGGRVLKITTDEDEAKTANHLKTRSHNKRIVKIFDVFRFGKDGGSSKPIFGLIVEKLIPLSEDEKKEFNDAIKPLRDHNDVLERLANGNVNNALQRLREKMLIDIETELGAGNKFKRERAMKNLENKMNYIKSTFDKFDIPEIAAALKSNNVKFADYHGNNLMKRGDMYVINDLGQSISPGTEPPIFEVNFSVTAAPGLGNIAAQGRKSASSPWSSGFMADRFSAEEPREDDEKLDEDKTADLQKKFPSISNDIKKLSDADTSKGKKYLNWAVKVLNNKEAKVDEIIKVISMFDKYQSKLQKKDIYQWNFKELKDKLDSLIKSGDAATNKEKAEFAKEGAEKIFEDEEAMVYRIDTKEASCKYGKGTKWCITSKDSFGFAHGGPFSDYRHRNILFYFLILKYLDKRNKFHKIANVIYRNDDNSIKKWEFFDSKDTLITSKDILEEISSEKFDEIQSKIYKDALKQDTNLELKIYKGDITQQEFEKYFKTILVNNPRIIKKFDTSKLDIKRLENEIIKDYNPFKKFLLYSFAYYIKDANIKRLEDEILKSLKYKSDYINAYWFFKEIKGSDIKKFENTIIKSNEAGFMSMDAVQNLPGINKKRLEDRVEQLIDPETGEFPGIAFEESNFVNQEEENEDNG